MIDDSIQGVVTEHEVITTTLSDRQNYRVATDKNGHVLVVCPPGGGLYAREYNPTYGWASTQYLGTCIDLDMGLSMNSDSSAFLTYDCKTDEWSDYILSYTFADKWSSPVPVPNYDSQDMYLTHMVPDKNTIWMMGRIGSGFGDVSSGIWAAPYDVACGMGEW